MLIDKYVSILTSIPYIFYLEGLERKEEKKPLIQKLHLCVRIR